MQAGFFDHRISIPWSIAFAPGPLAGAGTRRSCLSTPAAAAGSGDFDGLSLFARRTEQVKGAHVMKTMQMMKKSKNRACAQTWQPDSRADYRETSKGFSKRDVSELDHREGAF